MDATTKTDYKTKNRRTQYRHVISTSNTPKKTKNSDIKEAMVKKKHDLRRVLYRCDQIVAVLVGGEYRGRKEQPVATE